MVQTRRSTRQDGFLETPHDYLWEASSDLSELSTVLSTPRSSSPSFKTNISSPFSPDRLHQFSPGFPYDHQPTLPLREKPESKEDQIGRCRLSFFSAVRDFVYPLLHEEDAFRKRVTSIEDGARIQQPQALPSQPAGLRADLKAYQLEGLSFLLYLHENGIGGILGDEMGLGKTLQTLALFQSLKEADLPEDFHAPFLVVCPLSVLETWVSETVKWTPDLAVLKYHGSPAERSEMKKKLGAQKRKGYAGGLPDIVVTSYETILSDMAWFSRTFVWRYVVLDEGHRIKNFKAKRTLGLSKIQAEYKLVLTGTPIQNNLEELWSILHWLYPEVFVESSVTMFADAFSLSNGVFDRIFFEDITEFLKLIMLRREKGSPELGLSIPGKMEFIISVPLCDLQRTWYLRVLGIWSEINDFHGLPGSSVNGSEGASRRIKISQNILMELRKVCIHPYLLDSAMPCPYKVGVDLVMQSGKFQVLLRLVQRFVTEQKKVIIFSGFEGALDLCEDMLSMLQTSTATFRYARLDGHTSRAARNLATYLFQHDGRYLIFLISIRAGGEGLNLTSSSTVIFLDEDWNPQVMKQACSRVHRIGQTKPVEVFRIQARGTIEEQMARRLEKKAYMAERVTENVRAHKSLPGRTRMALPDMMCSPNAVGPEASMSYLPDDDDGLDAGLGACIIKRVNDQSVSGTLTAEEEEAWLERAERVRTDVLDGRRVGTRPKSVSTFDQQARVELRREDRRIGKERTVLIGGFQVSKESIAVCEALPSPKSPSAVSKGTKSGRITHESTCFLCRQRNTAHCDICPRSFHWQCLGTRGRETRQGYGLTCPHHYCCKCDKASVQAGGLLYPCISCDVAYCEHCLAWEETEFVGGHDEYARMGYSPSNAFYITCASCKRRMDQKRLLRSGTLLAGKRAKNA